MLHFILHREESAATSQSCRWEAVPKNGVHAQFTGNQSNDDPYDSIHDPSCLDATVCRQAGQNLGISLCEFQIA